MRTTGMSSYSDADVGGAHQLVWAHRLYLLNTFSLSTLQGGNLMAPGAQECFECLRCPGAFLPTQGICNPAAYFVFTGQMPFGHQFPVYNQPWRFTQKITVHLPGIIYPLYRHRDAQFLQRFADQQFQLQTLIAPSPSTLICIAHLLLKATVCLWEDCVDNRHTCPAPGSSTLRLKTASLSPFKRRWPSISPFGCAARPEVSARKALSDGALAHQKGGYQDRHLRFDHRLIQEQSSPLTYLLTSSPSSLPFPAFENVSLHLS